jgi:hypothetical protein
MNREELFSGDSETISLYLGSKCAAVRGLIFGEFNAPDKV